MKGIVFNLLEEVIRREHGEDVWDDLLHHARVEGAYTSLGNYPDGELLRLVGAASAQLRQPAQDVVRWFARSALPLLAEKYPRFFAPHASARSFLLTLNKIIHPEVRKLYTGADVPDFEFDDSADDVLLMKYNSARKLCAFAEGMIEGAAAHFHESLALEQRACMLRGDGCCVFLIRLQPTKAGAS
jgi:hypothetical protein